MNESIRTIRVGLLEYKKTNTVMATRCFRVLRTFLTLIRSFSNIQNDHKNFLAISVKGFISYTPLRGALPLKALAKALGCSGDNLILKTKGPLDLE